MATPYAHGFTSLEKEFTLAHLPVQGRLPPWLEGALIRNGPAKFEIGTQRYRHWFDGLAMLHKFQFSKGQVAYRNRFVRTRNYQKTSAKNKISNGVFATDPCRNIFQRVAAIFFPNPADNTLVNVTQMAGHYAALTETPMAVEFDLDSLDTRGDLPCQDHSPGQLTTAHPQYDYGRSAEVNYTLKLSRTSTYNLYRRPADQLRHQPIGVIPVKEPGYIHSFALTENYIVLAEYPLLVNPLRLIFSGKPFIENFRWQPQQGTRFYIVDQNSGHLVNTLTSEAFFAFHHINAFEQDHKLCLDIAAYPDANIIQSLYLDRLRGKEPGTLPGATARRYHLPLSGDKVRTEVLNDEFFELPRLNYRRSNGRPYRYAYGTGRLRQTPDDFPNQLIKLDLPSGSPNFWHQADTYPGEPVFVAAPDTHSEDSGVVLSVVLDALTNTSFLLVLDAASFVEIARAAVPHHIPLGFHGQFYPQ